MFFSRDTECNKKKNLLGTNYNIAKQDIKDLHMCISEKKFNAKKLKILKKWQKMNLNEFIIHFKKQWLESDFSK